MSGGSYDYLCFTEDAYGLAGRREALCRMHERLSGLPWGQVAADETARLLSALDRLDSLIRASSALREVWHAVEWWDSSDYSEEQARQITRAYEDLSTEPAPRG